MAAAADLAGGEWPERAGVAFVKVMGAVEDRDEGVLLLAHCQDAFGDDTVSGRITTRDLLDALVDRGDDSPWAGEWAADLARDEPKRPAMALARRLRPYGIKPRDLRIGAAVLKGYEARDFVNPWARYLTPPNAPEKMEFVDRSGLFGDQVATSLRRRSEGVSADNGAKPKTGLDQECHDVATSERNKPLRPMTAKSQPGLPTEGQRRMAEARRVAGVELDATDREALGDAGGEQ